MSLIHHSPGTVFLREAEYNSNNSRAMISGSGNLIIYRIYRLEKCFLNLEATKMHVDQSVGKCYEVEQTAR